MAYKTHPSGPADLTVTCDLISVGSELLVISRETTGLYVTDFPLNRNPAVTEWDKHRRSRTWAECRNKAERIVTEREWICHSPRDRKAHIMFTLYHFAPLFVSPPCLHKPLHNADENSCHLPSESLMLEFGSTAKIAFWLFTGVSTAFYDQIHNLKITK